MPPNSQTQTEAGSDHQAQQVEETIRDKLVSGQHISQDEASLAQSYEARTAPKELAKGSVASQAKSVASKQENFEAAAQALEEKMKEHPEQITKAEASHLESAESRAIGGARPPKDSISAEAKRMAAANASGSDPVVAAHKIAGAPVDVHAKGNETAVVGSSEDADASTAQGQSHSEKEKEYQHVASDIQAKMQGDPRSVTKEDAALLHSRDRRAHGNIDKDSLTSKVQHLSVENERVHEGTTVAQ